MKSSSGAYYAGLDHIRGLAAFLVVVWHFAHWTDGTPVKFNQLPLLGLFDEGHVGVAVFMTLSGYLFAKLIGDRQVHYPSFLWNRFLRLAPLLIVVLTIHAILVGQSFFEFLHMVREGMILPTLPNGGWSITVEAHFYVILPVLLWATAKDWRWIFALIFASITLRFALYMSGFDVRTLAYPTIVGRFDQFAIGVAAYRSGKVSGRVALGALALLWVAYSVFDSRGGYYGSGPRLWVLMPAFEGATIAAMIAWYDRHPLRRDWLLRKAGEYSYSIYLLHFFLVHQAALWVDQNIMRIANLWQALPWAAAYFLMMMLVGAVSWHVIEKPPLALRRKYVIDRVSPAERGEARVGVFSPARIKRWPK